MSQLAFKLQPAKTRDGKLRHRGSAKSYAKKFARTKDRACYQLMMLHLKASLA